MERPVSGAVNGALPGATLSGPEGHEPSPTFVERAAVGARAAVARAVLPSRAAPERIGEITLLPHQRALASLVTARIARWGGVLVSEPPGWGKTYTALAAVASDDGVVVAPAALRARWADALARSARRATFVSIESLSRRRAELTAPWIVIDESHHLRNPATRRYDSAAALCLGARVVMLTATPIQNRRDDLAAQLALFLGEGAFELPMAALASHVLRSAASEAPTLPAVAEPEWLHLTAEDAWLERIAALPPSVPPIDGGAAEALERYTLVRQWASSRAALVGGLRRRLGAAMALEESLVAGVAPTRHDVSAWEVDGDALQPAFPGLTTSARPTERRAGTAAMLRRIRRHLRAVRSLLGALSRSADSDAGRAATLRALLDRHEGARIVAFSAFAETVAALAQRLRAVPGVAWVTASGARIASGPLPRDELLRQFGSATARVPAAERVRLLLTTDVLSEGLDLQGASVVVHVDLPWNPARLEQRVGRLRRIGAASERVIVYAFAPPADAERLLRIEQRLRAKLATAATLGQNATPILPLVAGAADDTASAGEADLEAAIVARLERWKRPTPGAAGATRSGLVAACEGSVAAVRAERTGWLAVVRDGASARLVADLGDGPTDGRAAVAHALELAEAPGTEVHRAAAERAAAQLGAWSRRRAGRRLASVTADRPIGDARRRASRRLSTLVAGLDRPRRVALAPAIRAAREALARPAGIGFDRRLGALDTERDAAAWLDALAAAAPPPVLDPAGDPDPGTPVGEVLILLVADPR